MRTSLSNSASFSTMRAHTRVTATLRRESTASRLRGFVHHTVYLPSISNKDAPAPAPPTSPPRTRSRNRGALCFNRALEPGPAGATSHTGRTTRPSPTSPCKAPTHTTGYTCTRACEEMSPQMVLLPLLGDVVAVGMHIVGNKPHIHE
jgi:hypothetical protein